VVEVLNKIDLLPPEEGARIDTRTDRQPQTAAVSAVTGEGIDQLMAVLDAQRTAGRQVVDIDVDLADGATLSWVYAKGEVLNRQDDEDQAHLQVAIEPAHLARIVGRSRPAVHA
jgi:GTPase